MLFILNRNRKRHAAKKLQRPFQIKEFNVEAFFDNELYSFTVVIGEGEIQILTEFDSAIPLHISLNNLIGDEIHRERFLKAKEETIKVVTKNLPSGRYRLDIRRHNERIGVSLEI